MNVAFLLNEMISKTLEGYFHSLPFSIDEPVHSLHIFLNFVETSIDWGDLMEFMLMFAKNAVGTEKFLLSLAVNRNVAIVSKASDGLV